jgi:hypothetical protein
MIKKFHIGDIASITTGKLLSPKLIEGVYGILGFLTGEELYTHELPSASKFAKPFLLAKYPELSKINKDEINTGNYKEKLNSLVAEYGEYLEIESISKEWENRDKLEDDVILDMENQKLIINKKSA